MLLRKVKQNLLSTYQNEFLEFYQLCKPDAYFECIAQFIYISAIPNPDLYFRMSSDRAVLNISKKS